MYKIVCVIIVKYIFLREIFMYKPKFKVNQPWAQGWNTLAQIYLYLFSQLL